MPDISIKIQVEEAIKKLRQNKPELTDLQIEQARKQIEKALITEDTKDKLKKYFQDKPKKAVGLLKTWLSEDNK